MWDIKDQNFWEKLQSSFQKKVREFVEKYHCFAILENIQLMGSIVGIIYFCTPFGRKNMLNLTSKLNLNNNMAVYLGIIAVGVFYALMEIIIEPLKKNMEKARTSIKNEMIVKVCNCEGYCECREDLNNYMKKKGIKLLS